MFFKINNFGEYMELVYGLKEFFADREEWADFFGMNQDTHYIEYAPDEYPCIVFAIFSETDEEDKMVAVVRWTTENELNSIENLYDNKEE